MRAYIRHRYQAPVSTRQNVYPAIFHAEKFFPLRLTLSRDFVRQSRIILLSVKFSDKLLSALAKPTESNNTRTGRQWIKRMAKSAGPNCMKYVLFTFNLICVVSLESSDVWHAMKERGDRTSSTIYIWMQTLATNFLAHTSAACLNWVFIDQRIFLWDIRLCRCVLHANMCTFYIHIHRINAIGIRQQPKERGGIFEISKHLLESLRMCTVVRKCYRDIVNVNEIDGRYVLPSLWWVPSEKWKCHRNSAAVQANSTIHCSSTCNIFAPSNTGERWVGPFKLIKSIYFDISIRRQMRIMFSVLSWVLREGENGDKLWCLNSNSFSKICTHGNALNRVRVDQLFKCQPVTALRSTIRKKESTWYVIILIYLFVWSIAAFQTC